MVWNKYDNQQVLSLLDYGIKPNLVSPAFACLIYFIIELYKVKTLSILGHVGQNRSQVRVGASDLCYSVNNHLFVYFWLLPTISLDTFCMVSSVQRLSDSLAGGATLAADGAETGNILQPEKAASAISSQGLTARKD